MNTLPSNLRRQLENSIKQARKIAEGGARKALEALAVHEPDPYRHMDETQRNERRKLRAQARQLGDGESAIKRGAYEIKHLVEKLAYDQWHQLLFARFLLENNLLISPDHGVAVSLDDCEELAGSLGLKDAWAVAALFAAKELPEIFRADDPAGAVALPVEDRKPLIQLVTGLAVEVFTASDSLGWCYQFWQAERKAEVNLAGNKIGADELPAVTQLFTEAYMVDFLLDNTLGAWHAGKVLAAKPSFADTAKSEDELRTAMALPGCAWKFLRFIRGENDKWTPAAGTFTGWPKTAQELKCLDPCIGSGHFVVAMFERLVALRIAEEGIEPAEAVAVVIRDNLFGLEIDPRCTQIAAFNLALAAWRRVGHCPLPQMHLACSGLAPNTAAADWLALAGPNEKLKNGMKRLYDLFQNAPVLGSLINPRTVEGDLLAAEFHKLQPLLEKALAHETKDDTAHEMAVTARGLAKAAEILAGEFTLVATNVPYLKSGNQVERLKDFCRTNFLAAKSDLATCFIERCLGFCSNAGSIALVTPQNWLYQPAYGVMRRRLLEDYQWNCLAKLGPHAFETITGEVVNVNLVSISVQSSETGRFIGIEVSEEATPMQKAIGLQQVPVISVEQRDQLKNPEHRIVISGASEGMLLMALAQSYKGITSNDDPQFFQNFWEQLAVRNGWEFLQSTVKDSQQNGGLQSVVLYEGGRGRLRAFAAAQDRDRKQDFRGIHAWGKPGVAVSCTGSLPVSFYSGHKFDTNAAVITPNDARHLPAIWTFCSSEKFNEEVRKIDQSLKVTNATLVKIPFDLAHWQKVAAEKYPHGLPKPFSIDPTQWLFNGHPAGADQPLHVAVARLLGYQWPRQTGSNFPDCSAVPPDGLETLADADGIVCLSATKGEAPAAERLRALLAKALGSFDLPTLLASAGPAGRAGSKSETLEAWLRDEFFEQHCALFHHRPFIWHLWDGHKSGFSALVNAHRLDHPTLEKLTYAYLGDWLRRQQAAVDAGEAGSDARLAAAKILQARLKLILEGEPPFDLFVRWKPLSQQAIGWHPDLNDGVRMNIRPFLAQDIPGGKKGAGILRRKPNIKWEKDRGKEPLRDKKEFPWFWGWDEVKQDFAGAGKEPDGNRWNDCHYTNEAKKKARGASINR